MMLDFAVFDFGESYYRDRSVAQLVRRQDAGVDLARALDHVIRVFDLDSARNFQGDPGWLARFDIATSTVVVIGNAVPSFLFAILLIVVFAGGQYLDWFPLRGLHSDGWRELSWFGQVKDYFWHITLPLFSRS